MMFEDNLQKLTEVGGPVDKNLNSLRKPDKRVIKEHIRQVLEKHGEILFAYLHGSYVKGNAFQDIDVAVYLEGLPESVLEYELHIETELIRAIGRYVIDVRVLNTAPLSFKYNVIKDGVILLVRDDDKRADFQEETITAYIDFLPYRNIYLQETLGVKI